MTKRHAFLTARSRAARGPSEMQEYRFEGKEHNCCCRLSVEVLDVHLNLRFNLTANKHLQCTQNYLKQHIFEQTLHKYRHTVKRYVYTISLEDDAVVDAGQEIMEIELVTVYG